MCNFPKIQGSSSKTKPALPSWFLNIFKCREISVECSVNIWSCLWVIEDIYCILWQCDPQKLTKCWNIVTTKIYLLFIKLFIMQILQYIFNFFSLMLSGQKPKWRGLLSFLEYLIIQGFDFPINNAYLVSVLFLFRK